MTVSLLTESVKSHCLESRDTFKSIALNIYSKSDFLFISTIRCVVISVYR